MKPRPATSHRQTSNPANHMKNRLIAIAGALGALLGAVVPAGPAAAAEEDYEVLTRGPVHEAFAEAVSFEPTPGLIVNAAPPALIEELPPDQRPEGDHVAWIPGYWAWDDEQNDFLWISGIWRNLPPERQWVPGYWSDLGDGRWQWTNGYWADSAAAEVSYLAEAPPRSVEAGPNVVAPSVDHCWIPGVWVWASTRYAWRPGYWTLLRPDWTWVPARYCWTPRGYVFIDGYWDYAVGRRGVVFAPVHFRRPVWTRPGYYYTPGIVVALDAFLDHLFFRPRACHYYFGDYYAPRYRDAGYYAAFAWHNTRRGYDPIFAYQRWDHRHDKAWERAYRDGHRYLREHADARPPHTWGAMRRLDEPRREGGRARMFANTLANFTKKPAPGLHFRNLEQSRREQIVAQQRQMRDFGKERRRLEARGPVAGGGERTPAHRATLNRSPITGRAASEFARNQGPPERPEPRGNLARIKPGPPTDTGREGQPPRLPEIRREGQPGAKPQPEIRREGQPGTKPQPEIRREGQPPRLPEIRREEQPEAKPKPEIRREGQPPRLPEIRREVQPEAKPKPEIRRESQPPRLPEIRREVQPGAKSQPEIRREVPRQPEIRREAPRVAQPQPEIRREVPRQPEIRREAPRQPEIRREAPRNVQPQVRREVQPPQIRREAPRTVQPQVRREVQPPQIRREAPRTVQPQVRREVQPPQIRREAPRTVQPQVRREVQPPQVRREAPQRQVAPPAGQPEGAREERGRDRRGR